MSQVNPLDFLIRYRSSHPEVIKELAYRMTLRTGSRVMRQQVERWLNPDPKKRGEPKLEVGLMLIEEGRKIIENDKLKLNYGRKFES